MDQTTVVSSTSLPPWWRLSSETLLNAACLRVGVVLGWSEVSGRWWWCGQSGVDGGVCRVECSLVRLLGGALRICRWHTCVVASSRPRITFECTPDTGGVAASCNLGCGGPFDCVDNAVLRFGLLGDAL